MTMQDDLNNILREAAYHGDLPAIEEFVEMGADPAAGRSEALAVAAQQGHLDCVKRLLALGARLEDQQHLALRLETLTFLLDQGSDPCAKDNYAIGMATKNGHLDCVKLLHMRGADIFTRNNALILLAANAGHQEIVTYLQVHKVSDRGEA